jgi:hypothetical protein
MTNLLPDEYKKIINTEYKRRLFTVFLWILVAIITITIVTVLPLGIKIYFEEKQVGSELQLLKSKPAVLDYSSLEKDIKDTKKDLDMLKNEVPKRLYVANMIEDVLAVKPSGIRFDSIVWFREDKYFRFMIGGRGDNREVLRQFVNNLKSNPLFVTVDLPVSSFAKPEDVDFTITIKVEDLKNENRE